MTLSYRTQTKLLLLVNAIVALALCGWVALELMLDQEAVPDADENQTPEHSPILRQLPRVDAIDAHPLFSPTRRPVIAERPADQTVIETMHLPPLLVGILINGDGKVGGLLEDPPSGSRKFIRQGETFMGWTLISLHGKTAVLRFGAKEAELMLSFNSRSPQGPGSSDPATPAHRNP